MLLLSNIKISWSICTILGRFPSYDFAAKKCGPNIFFFVINCLTILGMYVVFFTENPDYAYNYLIFVMVMITFENLFIGLKLQLNFGNFKVFLHQFVSEPIELKYADAFLLIAPTLEVIGMIYLTYLEFEKSNYFYGAHFIFANIQYCSMILFNNVLVYFLYYVRARLVTINKAWDNMKNAVFIKQKEVQFEMLRTSYLRMCNAIDIFNNIFGLNLFLRIIALLLISLVLIQSVLFEGNSGDYEFTTKIACFIAVMSVSVVICAILSEHIANEGDVFAHRMCEFTSTLPDENRNKYLDVTYVLVRRPKISAGGFFDFNLAMLFTIVNIFVTYVIVVIQFQPIAT